MKTIKVHWIIRQALCLVCVSLLAGGFCVAQQPAPPAQASEQLLSPEQLDTLVAPVALYPDALLSQVLVAATYPLEIAEVGQWLQQNRNLQGPQLVDAARQQNWDPSIQALVVFPDVISRLNADIRWTTDLGNAFLSQQADVMNAVQRMRAQAMAAGKLHSNEQETVTTEMQGGQPAIEIQPANPEIVYVPYYNPEYIWGRPRYGYYPAWDYPGFGIGFGFGRGIYIGAFFGGLGWGGWGWGPNWYHCSIYQNHYFFNHYGYGGHGYRYGAVWTHDPGHRLGVRYPNSTLSHWYGGVSTARGEFGARRFGGESYAVQQHNSAYRANPAQAGGWNHFGQAGSTNQGAQRSLRSTPAYNGSRADHLNPSYGNSSAYRASPSTGGSYGGGNRIMPGYRSSPSNGNSSAYRASPSTGGSYGGGNRIMPSYRSSPSNGNSSAYRASPSTGGSYGGGNRTMPSYRSSPSSGGGGYQSSRSYSGGGSNRSGASSHGGGPGIKAGGTAPRMVQGIK
jgi:Protein of unknown function (DUF3300)